MSDDNITTLHMGGRGRQNTRTMRIQNIINAIEQGKKVSYASTDSSTSIEKQFKIHGYKIKATMTSPNIYRLELVTKKP